MRQKSHKNSEKKHVAEVRSLQSHVELSVTSSFLPSHPVNFDIKMHATGTIFVVEIYLFLQLYR